MSVQPVPTPTPDQPGTDPAATSAGAELDRQLRVLLDAGYPTLARMSVQAFTDALAPLRAVAEEVGNLPDARPGHVPLLLVVSHRLVGAEPALAATSLNGKAGFLSADLQDVDRFQPVEQVAVPHGSAYLLLDVERGDEYLNQSPDEAVPAITGRARSPLTYDEGIALLTQFPALLEKNRCFMTPASRCGDRRVPALWISSGTGKDGKDRRGAPKLGWCWAGNRHTWLGHASCATRLAAPSAPA